ncbi:TIM barrel protein [Candidatus Methanomassiliicoccus intestinalis]|uniref:TIM barrel protein n=1 Tax=Candidatus Methanomassiliicoccus intestinalis TaxID=1406512 RepID=UPI0037DDDCC8
MIRFGPAGIPLSCKGRTLRDGIEDVHSLGLTAMEVQMLRINAMERFPDEEEVGLSPLEIETDLIVEIIRTKGKKEISITDPSEPIKESDVLITLVSGLAQTYSEFNEIGEMGKEMDVQLSMHTPYYMDLGSNDELTEKCINALRWAGMMTDQMDGKVVVTHMGLYNDNPKKQTKKNIIDNLSEIMAWWDENGIRPKLGLEMSGRQEVFGSVSEIFEVCDNVAGTIPVINFAHVHARGGSLHEPEDFGALIDEVRKYTSGDIYAHFAGVEHEGGNEKRITPIKRGDLKFEPLAEYLADESANVTIISSSPLLEHDAMYMKLIYERMLTRKVSKETRAKKGSKEQNEDDEGYDISLEKVSSANGINLPDPSQDEAEEDELVELEELDQVKPAPKKKK